MKQGIFPIPICLRANGPAAANCLQVLPAGTPIGSVVPLSNVAQQLYLCNLNKIPEPNNLAALQLDFPDFEHCEVSSGDIKIDHSLSSKWNVFYRFENDKIPTVDADGSIGGRSNLPFVNRMESNSPGRTHTLQTTYAASPSLIFEGRYAYGYGAIFTKTVGLLAKDVSG